MLLSSCLSCSVLSDCFAFLLFALLFPFWLLYATLHSLSYCVVVRCSSCLTHISSCRPTWHSGQGRIIWCFKPAIQNRYPFIIFSLIWTLSTIFQEAFALSWGTSLSSIYSSYVTVHSLVWKGAFCVSEAIFIPLKRVYFRSYVCLHSHSVCRQSYVSMYGHS